MRLCNRTSRRYDAVALMLLAVLAAIPTSLNADEPDGTDGNTPTETIKADSVNQPQEAEGTEATAKPRQQRIARYLSGAIFTGQFTVAGKPESKPESYTISSCESLGHDDLYRMKVKIRYGDVDGEFPMDLRILWAGSTPVITLDSIWIPGLGTFSARVVIHQDRYAGTWQHDEKGGHLFGTISQTP